MTFVALTRTWQFAALPPRQKFTSFGLEQVMQKLHYLEGPVSGYFFAAAL
jgi:hypothetical protein